MQRIRQNYTSVYSFACDVAAIPKHRYCVEQPPSGRYMQYSMSRPPPPPPRAILVLIKVIGRLYASGFSWYAICNTDRQEECFYAH